jgi:hypothetical protein
VGKRLTAALAAALLLFALAACGGDDDDDDVAVDDTEEASDEGAEEQAEVDEAKAAFCADLDDDTADEHPLADVVASRDLALAAQTAADTEEQIDALQAMADFADAVIEGDDGDEVVTPEEVQAAVEERPTIEDAIAVATDFCAGEGDDGGDEAAAGDAEAFCTVGSDSPPTSPEELRVLAEEAERLSPPELVEAVAAVADAYREAADAEDFMAAATAASDDPDLAEAFTAIESWCADKGFGE